MITGKVHEAKTNLSSLLSQVEKNGSSSPLHWFTIFQW
jgi:hypothetical protein